MKHLLLTTIAILIIATIVHAEPIHDAATLGDLDLVQAELDKGIDVNIKDSEYGCFTINVCRLFGNFEVTSLNSISDFEDLDIKINYKVPLLRCSLSIAKKRALKFPFPKELAPLLCIISKNIVGL